MFKKAIEKVLKRRHFWRQVGFNELSELYVAIMLRGMAVSLTGLFVPMYMLRLGYDVTAVCTLVAWFFVFRACTDIFSAYVIAAIGPKHTMVIGYVFQLISTTSFIVLKFVDLPLWFLGALWGASATLFFVPFHVDFSKVKHSQHAGKELGYLNIMERVGSLLGPVVGGLVATLFGAQYTFALAVVILFLGLVPLFQTAEPVRVHQKISFRTLKVDGLLRNYFAHAAFGVENTLSMLLWPLYLGALVLVTNQGYAQLGVLLSTSFLVSIIAARLIGRRIDQHKGRRLLRQNAVLNAGVHLIRPFVQGYGSAFVVNVANEAVTVGYRMPFVKGMYDAADDLPGHRIVYFASMEFVASVVKGALWWGLVLLSTVTTSRALFGLGFAIAALASLLITTENFKALRTPKRRYE
jgi:Major Facilitator Superfamily